MKYSIVIPAYNSSKTIAGSINSVLKQSYKDLELIIVDDGSTDDTLKICKQFEKRDDRVVVYTKTNKGPGAARNYGVKRCTGDYISFLDSDDYYDNDYLETVNNVIAKKPYDFIFINTINERNNGRACSCDNISKYKDKSKDELMRLQVAGTIPWGPCSKVCKADIVKSNSFSNLPVGEESIYSFDLLYAAKSIIFVEKGLYHYVHNAKGQHTKGGMDPWGPVVDKLAEHISEKKIIGYESAINALALKGLALAIYRISINNRYLESRKQMKEKIKEYLDRYDIYNYDSNVVDFKTNVLARLIKVRLYLALYVLSKIRKTIDNKKDDL